MLRDTPQRQPSVAGGSLLSGVFSFVSREIESFVATATGGEAQVCETAPHLPRRTSSPGTSQDGRAVRRRERRRQPETSRRTVSDRPKTPSPPPEPRRPPPSKPHAVTMPGSLFPRSPSMLPEAPPTHHSRSDDPERRVRFTPRSERRCSSSSGAETDTDTHAGPSRPRTPPRPSRKHPRAQPSPPTSPEKRASPARAPLASPSRSPSVKEAVKRFRVSEDDAHFSLLLPKEPISPGKGKAREAVSGRGVGRDLSPVRRALDKGKQRASEPEPEFEAERQALDDEDLYDEDTSGEVRVQGKERELLEAKEDQTRKERQWELDKDKARQDEEDRERGKDKDRIKMLENEILRLKEELSKRPNRQATPAPSTSIRTQMLPPPPPPPPPPVPGPPGASARLPTSSADPTTTSTLAPDAFASARAALKQTAKPIELPINFGGLGARSKRQGQPTFNIDGEKMAAFLTEMKSVRLRKTGPTPHAGPRLDGWKDSIPERDMGLTRSLSAGGKPGLRDWGQRSVRSVAEPSSILSRHGLPSFRSLENRTETAVGEKRKRDATDAADDAENAAKRRNMVTTPSSSTSSRGMAPPPSDNIHRHPANRTWPSLSTETDLTTPELLSDNENEVDRGDSSVDDRPPSTPPMLRTIQRIQKSAQGASNRDLEMPASPRRDHHLLFPEEPARKPASPHMQESELFSKRLPKSPLPLDTTPRKPRPPARPLSKPKAESMKPKPKSNRETGPRRVIQEDDDDEDPLSLSFTSPDEPLVVPQAKTQLPTASGGKKKKKSASVHEPSRDASQTSTTPQTAKKRSTLDEELRDARARSLLREHDLVNLEDLQNGEFIGVGTRKKTRGFLAHGGSSGLPVFMGEGYVDGAEPSDDDGDYQPRKSTSSAVAARRKNRR